MANWLYNSLLKQWCEENRITYRRGKDMTKTMEKVVGRIYEELAKWCAERNVVYEYNFSTDDGESCTFITSDTTLTVNHVEKRDPEQFSRYVKSVLFGVDDIIIDHLKAQVADRDARIKDLEREDKEKVKDIDYLEKELEKVRRENTGLKYQLDMMNTMISELNDTVREKENNLNDAADKIVQLKCANTSLKEQINILKCALNNEREGYGELNDRYEDRCKAYIDMCKNYDSEVNKRMKAEYELKELKSERHDDAVDVTRYLVVLAKKKRAEEMVRSLKKENDGLKDANSFLSVKLGKRDEIINDLDNHVKNLVAQEEILKREINALEYKNARMFGLWKNSDKPGMAVDLSLSEVMKDIKEQQEILDTLKSLDERIAWMEDHMGTAEKDVKRSIEKLEEDQKKIFYDELNIFTRLSKLEEAQPKKAKTSKKSQKSDLS